MLKSIATVTTALVASAALILAMLAFQNRGAASKAHQFDTQAWSFSQERIAASSNMKAVRESGATCVHHTHRRVGFVDEKAEDFLGAALVGARCGDEAAAVAVTLYARDFGESPAAAGYTVLIRENAAALAPLSGRKDLEGQIQTRLTELIEGEPFDAARLPPWPEGALVPALPYGAMWDEGVERPLYEALRAGDGRVWCYRPHRNGLTCHAAAPGRRAAIRIFNVSGLGPYDIASTNDAVDVLTGKRPGLPPDAYRASERATTEMVLKAAQDVLNAQKGRK